jgi:UDP-N-acetylmuramate--alanine ligase
LRLRVNIGVVMSERVHIIGIGGAGMSGIARILNAQGWDVTGSDARDSRRLTALNALGVQTYVGHQAEQVVGANRVIVSTAIPVNNVERVAAAAAGIPVLSRADAVAEIMASVRGIAVSGTHGKTTTTSMLTVALQRCGADPSYIIGSELNETGSNAHLGSGDLFVVEADESDGSFLHIPAICGIVTNVEADHLNHWGDVESLRKGFSEFVEGINGPVAICIDDPGGRALADQHDNAITYGTSDDAMVRIECTSVNAGCWSMNVMRKEHTMCHVDLQVPGRHNALNAVAAVIIGEALGFAPEDLAEGLGSFTGTRRRFEFKGEVHGVRVFDDYAHHPTEIEATLIAARDVVGSGRLIVAFQAHHYYRTALFSKEFGVALGLADEVVVLEVFAPGETPIPGASGQTMANNVPLPRGQVHFEPSWSAVPGRLLQIAQPGDVIMTLGAGDIGLLGTQVLALMREGLDA